jgi:hypothetical protein|tara:strand:+ start:3863 stop:4252 length:390 start_codon:yes stop_codon:yes gene_type:complete
MTNEMKLITALCDALGFEVEKACVNQDDIDYMLRGGASFRPDPIYEYKLTTPIVMVETVEEPFTKLKESDEIFNTEMFGEVMISRGTIYGTRIDSKRNGQYLTNFVEDNISITSMIKVIDNMYSERRKA